MNGDTVEVMKAISDSRAEMLKAVGDLHQQFSGFRGAMESRVTAVETTQQIQERRQWYHSIIVFVTGAVHHGVSNWFGWKI